jgi:DNA-binding winged helix-turn-helix (wHTH) protein
MRVRFGDCVLDSDTRQLLVRGETVHLSPKAFQFLELLLESRPRALSKSEIHERLWPGTFVSDGTLASLLAEVRSATEDSARESRFVRTVHRFGYAFSGGAEELRGNVSALGGQKLIYRLIWGNRDIPLRLGENLLGRDEAAIVWIDDALVSRRHAARRRGSGGDP